jgi:Zn-finger nucleic acid-binding protein
MEAEALNCPNCGAAVASDSTKCEFCKTRLKTVACPDCFGLMFVGSQYCGHCGAKAVRTTLREGDDLGVCPRCRVSLEQLNVGSTSFRECHRCDGLWADVDTFEEICASREEQSTVLGFIGKRELKGESPGKISYVPCPVCKQLMNRSNFARASGVIIDTCKQHGVWFDAEELPRIIEFIQKGGMEIARQRERHEIEEQRDRLRDEQRELGFQNRTLDEKEDLGPDPVGIKSFLGKLFD